MPYSLRLEQLMWQMFDRDYSECYRASDQGFLIAESDPPEEVSQWQKQRC